MANRLSQRELGGGQRIGEGRCDGDDGEDQGEDVLHQVQRGGPFNVVDNPAPLGHHRGHGGEVGVHQHQVRDLGGHVTAGAMATLPVGLLQASTSLTPSPVMATVCSAWRLG